MIPVVNRGDYIESLSEEAFRAGTLKFNIQVNGISEGVWGWAEPEQFKIYDDDMYFGTITAILVNEPLAAGLSWGDEVVLRCRGSARPILDQEWLKNNCGV